MKLFKDFESLTKRKEIEGNCKPQCGIYEIDPKKQGSDENFELLTNQTKENGYCYPNCSPNFPKCPPQWLLDTKTQEKSNSKSPTGLDLNTCEEDSDEKAPKLKR